MRNGDAWLMIDDVYRAIKLFTANEARRERLRGGLRDCGFRRARHVAYVAFFRDTDLEFSAWLKKAVA